MYFDMHVEALDDNHVTVTAILDTLLSDDMNQAFLLDGGDQFSVCLQGQCSNLEPSYGTPSFLSSDLKDYRLQLPNVADVPYTVMFLRPYGGSAVNSSVILPGPIAIQSPSAGQEFTDGSTVTVAWTPAGSDGTATVERSAVCNRVAGGWPVTSFSSVGESDGWAVVDSDHNGFENIGITNLIAFAQPPVGAPPEQAIADCTITLTVKHTRTGSIDPIFAGGRARATVRRNINIVYRRT